MKILLTFALLCACAGVSLAQEQQVNIAAQYDHSPGTGHSDGVGARAELVLALADKWRLVTGGVFSHEPKAYLGNGTSLRAGAEARYTLLDHEGIKPFVSGGAALSNNTTTGPGGYSKTAVFVTAGAGVSFNNRYIVAWKHFFRERHTQNRAASDLVEFTAYLPFSPGSKWRYVAGAGLQRTTFTQPTGSFAGKRTAWSYRVFGGVGRVF